MPESMAIDISPHSQHMSADPVIHLPALSSEQVLVRSYQKRETERIRPIKRPG